MSSKLKVRIRLTCDLPIDKSHNCFIGSEFDAYYMSTKENDDGTLSPCNIRNMPVEFIGAVGSPCVAFSHEYKVLSH